MWGRLAVSLAGSLTAAIGRNLRPQRTTEPVDLRLDLGGRVGILMVEHRQEIRHQAEHDADGPRLGDPRGLQAVVAELGERGEDGSYNPHQYGLYTQLNSWVVVRTI